MSAADGEIYNPLSRALTPPRLSPPVQHADFTRRTTAATCDILRSPVNDVTVRSETPEKLTFKPTVQSSSEPQLVCAVLHRVRGEGSLQFRLVMQLVIRRYRPSDRDAVFNLFRIGMKEHIRPCFHSAMTSPLYLAITLVMCIAGYLLGSVLGAVMLPGIWVGLVYFCCHELYARFVRKRLQTDMQDIPGNYLSRPGHCFWVTEAEVDGRAQIVGMVAVTAKQSGTERHGELFRMIISPLCRRMGLGFRMAQTVVDFCKEQGFSKLVLETSSTQMAAVALYKKLGFSHTLTHTKAEVPFWVLMLAKVVIIRMEKTLVGLD